MIFKKTFKFRLDPTNEQSQLFACFAGACRFVYNRGLAQRNEVYENQQKCLSYYDQNNDLPALKKTLIWLADIHSQVLQQALKDLNSAFSHFFRRVKKGEKPGFPRFKRKGIKDSFRYPQGVKVDSNRVYLPIIGKVKFRKSREILGTIKQTTVIKEGDHWFVCFSCEIERADPVKTFPDEKCAVGIDVGIADFATLAVGIENRSESVGNPRFLRENLEKLRKKSKELSRKIVKSKNWIRCKNKIRKLHSKIKNCRNDFAHKLSYLIVKSHDVICVESLNIVQMLEQGTKTLSRSIADAGWSQFLTYLKYKSDEAGKHFVEAGQFFPSSQLCSCCGHKQKIGLEVRDYHCAECGLNISRDLNAAINIKTAGMSVLNACGAIIR